MNFDFLNKQLYHWVLHTTVQVHDKKSVIVHKCTCDKNKQLAKQKTHSRNVGYT